MESPKVSIIIPAYKSDFLYASLKSILNQTYQNCEVIIVDDASPFDIKTIIKNYNEQIHYYRNPENMGRHNLVAAWNKAISYATGELIILASDDDIYDRRFVETLVGLSVKYPRVDLFHCRVGVINDQGEPIYWGASVSEYETDIDFVYQRAINRRTQLISDFMFRKTAIDGIGGFVDYPKAWYSDEMTVYKLAHNKGVVCSQETLFYWRSSEQNISSQNNDTLQKAKASVEHLRNMNQFLSELKPASEKDMFLLSGLRQNISAAIKRQLIYDMSKSSISIIYKIFRKYPNLFTSKEKAMLAIGKFRCVCHI